MRRSRERVLACDCLAGQTPVLAAGFGGVRLQGCCDSAEGGRPNQRSHVGLRGELQGLRFWAISCHAAQQERVKRAHRRGRPWPLDADVGLMASSCPCGASIDGQMMGKRGSHAAYSAAWSHARSESAPAAGRPGHAGRRAWRQSRLHRQLCSLLVHPPKPALHTW